MDRREFLQKCTAGAAAGFILSNDGVKVRRSPKDYNILLLQTDEHSPHSLGCYGNKIVKTPALDSLAQNGTMFTAAYCQNPICVPSRMSMLTGKMASDVGVYGNSEVLAMEHKTFADVFNAAGYVTAIIGKMHFQGQGEERVHGFYRPYGDGGSEETWKKPAGYLESRLPEDAVVSTWPIEDEQDTGVTNHSLEFLDQHKDKKFFLISSFRKPHFPFTIFQEYYDLYKDTADLPPEVTQEMLDDLPLPSQNEREKYGFASLTDEQIRVARAHYYGMTTYIDDQVKAILDKLDELGIRDNTIIIYTSDHGEMLGEHGLWYKNCFYEASAGIPFLWSFPRRLPSGKTIGAPVMNIDIFPTLCELCGLDGPDDLQGKSLLPLMKGTEDGTSRIALSENYRGGTPAKMVRTYGWKYTYYTDGKEQLFDMKNDPEETENLINDPQYASLAQELKAKALENWNYMGYYD